ncbi:MAG TPA: c-type cytochrome [Gammaproteobacteria bacterium]|nr:c-type cytochrome [Gammaproteobacteria bacterium]
MSKIKYFLAGMVALAFIIAVGIVAVIFSGVYDIEATRQHFRPVFWALAEGLQRSVASHSRGLEAPKFTHAAVLRGAIDYSRHCRRCHGAPGVAPDEFALGLEPVPISLLYAARKSKPREIFWAVKHGIKMTGMPAWDYRLDDGRIWDITAFVESLPTLAPSDYPQLLREAEAQLERPEQPASPVPGFLSKLETGRGLPPSAAAAQTRTAASSGPVAAAPLSIRFGDPRRGRRAIPQYGCMACHRIPGILSRDVYVGPPLRGIAVRNYVGGVLPNTPLNLMRWLLDTHGVKPKTAMPTLGLTAQDAADIAAYLYTLSRR